MKVCKAPRKEFETHTHTHMHSNISFWMDYHREFLDISYSLLCVFLGLRHFGCDISIISRRFPPTKGAPALAAPAAGRQYLKDKASEARQRLGRGTAWADWLLGRRWLLSQLMMAVQLILPGKDEIFRFFRPGCLQKYEDVEKFCMEVILYTTCFCLLNMSCAWLII